jgi:hypothetical protein
MSRTIQKSAVEVRKLRKRKEFIMKNKKFISLALALAMVFSMSVSVFASGGAAATPAADPNEFNATATVKIPDIDVTVPATAPLFINPMGFEVKIANGDVAENSDAAYEKTSNKIVSPVFIISNASPMKLDVNVIGSVTPAETNKALAIATAPITAEDTKNSVFIYANFGTPTGSEGQEVLAAPANGYTAPAENATTFPQLALTTKVPTKPVNVGQIAKSTGDATKLGFQFLGDCAANPKTDWNPGDKVDVKLIFSFKPVAETPATPASGG